MGYEGVQDILYEIDNALPPSTKIIYEQMAAAHKGLLIDSIPSRK